MRPEHSDLQARVDEYMDKFERSEFEAQQAAQARLNVMDEDGFTVVTSAGNKGYNTDGVIRIQAIKAEEAKKIKPKKKELQDFYRFQMREAKRDSTFIRYLFVQLRERQKCVLEKVSVYEILGTHAQLVTFSLIHRTRGAASQVRRGQGADRGAQSQSAVQALLVCFGSLSTIFASFSPSCHEPLHPVTQAEQRTIHSFNQVLHVRSCISTRFMH
jgi:hypothetical protein